MDLFVKRAWPPSAFVPLSFFFTRGPLRLGEMLHLVREEILLRPVYDPQPSVVLPGLLMLVMVQTQF